MPAPDLYEAIGAQRTDDTPAIRRAYRRAAKKVHPDQNPKGDRARWALVCLAKDVLTDAERRARYDATGRVEAAEPDNRAAHAMMKVSQYLDAVLQAIDDRGARFEEYDVLGDVERGLRKELREKKDLVARMRKDVAKLQDVARRFRPKAGKPDRIGPMLQSRATALEQAVAGTVREQEVLELALGIVSDHTFDWAGPRPGATSGGSRMDTMVGERLAAAMGRGFYGT